MLFPVSQVSPSSNCVSDSLFRLFPVSQVSPSSNCVSYSLFRLFPVSQVSPSSNCVSYSLFRLFSSHVPVDRLGAAMDNDLINTISGKDVIMAYGRGRRSYKEHIGPQGSCSSLFWCRYCLFFLNLIVWVSEGHIFDSHATLLSMLNW